MLGILRNAVLLFLGFLPRSIGGIVVLVAYWGAFLLFFPLSLYILPFTNFWLPMVIAYLMIYPALENVPPKYAIIRRNEWMIDKADLLIAYVTHGWGGAARTYRYAKQKGIPTVNLAEAKNA